MADIPGNHLGHARLHRVALGGHNQVSAHGGDLLNRRALARLPQKGHLQVQSTGCSEAFKNGGRLGSEGQGRKYNKSNTRVCLLFQWCIRAAEIRGARHQNALLSPPWLHGGACSRPVSSSMAQQIIQKYKNTKKTYPGIPVTSDAPFVQEQPAKCCAGCRF